MRKFWSFLIAEIRNLKESQVRQQQQCTDAQRRERILMRRLANKEQEIQDYVSQIAEYKAAQAPGIAALRSVLLDPAVNLLFEKLKKELQATKAKLEETQNELSAWKFTPDSNTGKRLMAKCRLLYQENEELGKMTSNGRLAKLESELAMQKSFSEEVKKSQSELDDFLQELDEDVEGMQSTILFLQQELKTTKDRIQFLEKENLQLKNCTVGNTEMSNHLVTNGKDSINTLYDVTKTVTATGKENGDDETEISEHVNMNEEKSPFIKINNRLTVQIDAQNDNYSNSLTDNENPKILMTNSSCTYSSNNDNDSNEILEQKLTNNINNQLIESSSKITTDDDVVKCNTEDTNNYVDSNKTINLKKRNYESDSSCESGGTNCGIISGLPPKLRNNKKLKKKTRRSSVLSIDLNEEDTKIAASEDDEISNQKILTRRKSTRNHQNGDN